MVLKNKNLKENIMFFLQEYNKQTCFYTMKDTKYYTIIVVELQHQRHSKKVLNCTIIS